MDEKYNQLQASLQASWEELVYDWEDLIENNLTCFLTICGQTFRQDDMVASMVPRFVNSFFDINDVEVDMMVIISSIIEILKNAHFNTICYNDYTVLDMASVEVNNSNLSKAKCLVFGTSLSLNKAYQWHVLNNTHEEFTKLYIPVTVFDGLLDEDEFFVVKYFEKNENLRMFKLDQNETMLRIAVSPHIKARSKRVRKSILMNTQNEFYIDYRYSQQPTQEDEQHDKQ